MHFIILVAYFDIGVVEYRFLGLPRGNPVFLPGFVDDLIGPIKIEIEINNVISILVHRGLTILVGITKVLL